jgi:spermidine/putrescine transport system permease protein
MSAAQESEGARRAGLLSPALLWLGLFFLAPIAIVAALSVATRGPYGAVEWTLTAANFARALDPLYLPVYWRTLWIAGLTTIVCLAVGYPVAYLIATRASAAWKSTLLILAIVPFWTSFLVRTYAWRFLLQEDGAINGALGLLGLPTQKLLYTDAAVLLGQVYGELPFMILPLYAALERLDRRLLEAASDLGAGPVSRFVRVTVPLTRSGIVAGCVLVFVPSLGAFITPDMLGGARSMMVGTLIQNQFVQRDQPFGSAVSMLLAATVLALLVIAWRAGARDES